MPGWRTGLLSMARKAAADEDALGAWAEREGFHARYEGILSASLSLLGLPPAVRERAFLRAAGGLRGKQRISSRLAAAAFSALTTKGCEYRGGGLLLRKEGDSLILSATLDFPSNAGYFVRIERSNEGTHHIRMGPYELYTEWTNDRRALGIRESAFCFPLIVRSRRPGDALSIRGGRKPLDELFVEWGIKDALKSTIPVVEDGAGIVGVLGAQFGGRNRYRPSHGCEDDRLFSISVKGA